MEKLLTVSVAAYNGAATLQKALSSCLVADESLQALLDVIIIDVGSTDGTAALAHAQWKQKDFSHFYDRIRQEEPDACRGCFCGN